jgi:hypothetical protein
MTDWINISKEISLRRQKVYTLPKIFDFYKDRSSAKLPVMLFDVSTDFKFKYFRGVRDHIRNMISRLCASSFLLCDLGIGNSKNLVITKKYVWVLVYFRDESLNDKVCIHFILQVFKTQS